jgi:hypothetical protein
MTPARLFSRAALCHRLGIQGVAVALVVTACGGKAMSSVPDDGGSGAPVVGGACPSAQQIASGAALGQPCSVEGEYCPDPNCDPCTSACKAARCAGGVFSRAVNTALCVPTPGTDDEDAPDSGGVCADLSTTGFDKSCEKDVDCTSVGVGTLCSTGPSCTCAADAINVSDQSRYQTYADGLRAKLNPPPGGCMCPAFGVPRCVSGQCTMCGGASPSCPDAG